MSRDSVIAALRELGSTSRAELTRRTGLSRATVSSVLAELQAAGLVDAGGSDGGGPGRPAELVRLNRAAGTAVGIDFGKRHLRVVLSDLGHHVLAERCVELAFDHEASTGIERAAELVAEVLEEAGSERDTVVAVGMGLPGPVRATGELGSSTILPGWVGVRAAAAMSERLDLAVTVDNDANLGALAEWTWGAARGSQTIAYVKVSTGIGAGLIVDGRPFRGAGGTAGELGHIVVDPHGPICRCGNRGCLETLVGAQALIEPLRPSLGELALGEVLERAHAGDAACRRVLADAGGAIGSAMATLCNLFDPECVVVGGDLAAAGDLLLAPAREALSRAAIADAELLPATLGDRAEVLGAIALALRESGLGLAPVAEAA